MVDTLQEAQLPLLACVLILACITKIAFREAGETIGTGTIAAFRRYRPAVIAVAVVEGSIGAALLLTAHPAARLATVVVFFVATSVVFDLRTSEAHAGCGCFGGLSNTPVRFRTLLRAFLFLLAALAVVGMPATGLDVIRAGSGWVGAVVATELAVVAALSPEIGVLLARRRERTPCEQRTVPLSETFSILRASRQWREHAGMIATADPVDVWRELCWRFLVYPGRAEDKDVEIVFAVSTEERNPTVRVAIVRPEDSDTGPNPLYALSV
ncbi:MAG TPA: MauE/DoxX family redox-associated membrane protein [Streptosporangiaceae bacterium]|jgi:hypothetical protein